MILPSCIPLLIVKIPEIVDSLDNGIRDDLQRTSHLFFGWVLFSAFVVVVGVALEGPEIFHEMWPRRFTTKGSVSHIRKFKRIVKIIGLFGWLLVVLGVAGEGVFEALQNRTEGRLQTFNDKLLTEARLNAGTAKQSALDAASASTRAREESDKASASSASAVALAQGARKEVDSFQRDIVSVKQQAADAKSQIAEALKEAAASTAELQRLKSPRSLTNVPKLIDTLKAFKGNEYTLNVFQDDESIELTRAVDDVLRKAGWIRKQPEVLESGIPALNVFTEDNKEPVPICVETGISIHLRMPQMANTPEAATRYFETNQMAATLRASLAQSVSPSDDHNVELTYVRPGPTENLTICVGKKP